MVKLKDLLNEGGMELKKLEDAIKMFQKKIKKQGRVTNARDEEHLERLMKVYNDMGGRKIKENNESLNWLYEKCWKGYEKKGMKTMFGKRYPNCVKKESKVNEYTYGKGDIVKDINPTCPHYGAVGKVKSVNPKSVVFVVMNKGKTYKPGDVLDKTHDQMTQMIPKND